MSLGIAGVAACGGAEDPKDTTPATNDNDGFKEGAGASVGGEVEAGEVETNKTDAEPDPNKRPPAQQPPPQPQPQPKPETDTD